MFIEHHHHPPHAPPQTGLWRRKWQPTLVLLPGESRGQGNPVGCRLWGRTESDTTDATYQQQQQTGLSSPPQGGGSPTHPGLFWQTHRVVGLGCELQNPSPCRVVKATAPCPEAGRGECPRRGCPSSKASWVIPPEAWRLNRRRPRGCARASSPVRGRIPSASRGRAAPTAPSGDPRRRQRRRSGLRA